MKPTQTKEAHANSTPDVHVLVVDIWTRCQSIAGVTQTSVHSHQQ